MAEPLTPLPNDANRLAPDILLSYKKAVLEWEKWYREEGSKCEDNDAFAKFQNEKIKKRKAIDTQFLYPKRARRSKPDYFSLVRKKPSPKPTKLTNSQAS